MAYYLLEPWTVFSSGYLTTATKKVSLKNFVRPILKTSKQAEPNLVELGKDLSSIQTLTKLLSLT